jgi:tripartite-type tricarboxylate transporter receptor subunit TctC
MLKTMKPDGYNICCGMNNILFLPLQQEVAFEPLKDFTYICTITDSILGIAVKSSSGWKTAKDFISYAKANPGKIKYANSAGAGTPQHMAMSEVALKEGIKWELVPYVGGVQSFAALLGGHVQAAYGNILNITSYLKSGELTLLWVLAEERSKLYPNVPTLKELGFFSYSGPVGIIGPPGMPKDLVSFLDETFHKALSDPEVAKTFKNTGAETCYMNSADYKKWATESYARYDDIIKQLGLQKK